MATFMSAKSFIRPASIRGLIGPEMSHAAKIHRRVGIGAATEQEMTLLNPLEAAAMKAWRFYGFNDLRLDDVPDPVCPPGHVVVEPLWYSPA